MSRIILIVRHVGDRDQLVARLRRLIRKSEKAILARVSSGRPVAEGDLGDEDRFQVARYLRRVANAIASTGSEVEILFDDFEGERELTWDEFRDVLRTYTADWE